MGFDIISIILYSIIVLYDSEILFFALFFMPQNSLSIMWNTATGWEGDEVGLVMAPSRVCYDCVKLVPQADGHLLFHSNLKINLFFIIYIYVLFCYLPPEG